MRHAVTAAPITECNSPTGKRWYEHEGHRLESVTNVLGWVYGWEHWTRRPDEWAIDRYAYERTRGQAVHTACSLLATKRLDWSSVSPEIRPYTEAFDCWLDKFHPAVLHSELRVRSLLWWFAGRLDLACRLAPGVTLVDIKTGQKNPLVRPQVAAYRQAYRETTGETQDISRAVLYLREDGSFCFEWLDDGDDWAHFEAALGAYRSAQALGVW